MSNRSSRYSDRPAPNKQERAAHRADERQRREIARCGHDDAADARAARLISLRALRDSLTRSTDDADVLRVVEQTYEESKAEILAEGPVGCTCAWPVCVETRKNRGDQP